MISAKNGISIRTFQKQRLRPGHWVDTRRFLSKTKCELANGLFEVFGDFSNEPANLVRDNLIGWIYDNFRDVGRWTKLMLKEKEQTLSEWIEHTRKETTPGDDMCLYLLARMYNKHVYVHNKLFYWCMAIHKIKSEIDLELIRDCAIELVFVHPWVFSEVKRVRIPKGIVPTPSTTPTAYEGKNVGITENSKPSQSNETKECSVVLMIIKTLQDANVTLQSQQEQLTTRCTGRKCTVTDYKKLADYTEEDEVTAPVKQKKPTNLLHKPSRNRQKIERTRQKNKKNKAASEMSNSKAPASGNIGTFPPLTISDSI